tara:strand:- start:129 stop:770 length:642 start_codon:yes stop_codon:yes gene_type:complete
MSLGVVTPQIVAQSINICMEQLDRYINEDGTYTSPKNGKIYKSIKAIRAHLSYAGTTSPTAFAERLYNVKCEHCNEEFGVSNIKRHQSHCYLNSDNLTLCKVCSKPIKNYTHSKGTCSRSCANIYFRSGENNGNFKGSRYTTICWQHHKKECIVCGEDKIVAVHHNDHNHKNNDPENLIPLCPTHHMYVHSKFSEEIKPYIEEYIKKRSLRFA